MDDKEAKRQKSPEVTRLDLGTSFFPTNSTDLIQTIPDESRLEGQLTDGPAVVRRQLSEDYNQLDEPILDTLLRDLNSILQKIKIVSFPLSSYDIHKVVMRGWDLWGPLLLCTFLAFGLHHSDDKDSYAGLNFSDIFVMLWLGSYMISLNFRLLSVSSGSHNCKTPHNYEMDISEIDRRQEEVQQKIAEKSVIPTRNETQTGSGDARNLQVDPSAEKSVSLQRKSARRSLFCPPSLFQLMCVFGYNLMVPCLGLIILKTFPFSRLLFERIVIGLLFGFIWPTFCSVRILFRYQTSDKRALAVYPIGLFYFVLSFMIIMDH